VPTLDYELDWIKKDFALVAGIDEAGRGAWAGPVVAAAVIFDLDTRKKRNALLRELTTINDSKKLSARQRELARELIETHALAIGVGQADNVEIDARGILPATRLAMCRAIAQLALAPNALLIDAVHLPAIDIAQRSFNFADSLSLSVAAASIIAKTTRDALMCAHERDYPQYQFSKHKGYGTAAHRLALDTHGACALHRMTFRPLQPALWQNPHV